MKDKEELDSENPYATPVEVQSYVPTPFPNGAGGAYIRQVKPLCICMIIQGTLETLMGTGFILMGIVVPAMIQMNQRGPQQVQTILILVYSVMGLIALVVGVLRIVAGIRGLYFRGYVLGITTHFLGMLNFATLYCLPTSLALCIWGCMVHFNPEVKYAFRMGAEGQDANEIEAGFTGQPKL